MRILFVVNVDWFFLSHRLPLALACSRLGYEVHLATQLTEHTERLKAFGFIVHPLKLNRSDSGVFSFLRLLVDLFLLFKKLKPDVLHLVTIKPVLIGGLASRLAAVHGVVCAISGLGHVFVSESWLGRLRRALVVRLYRIALGGRNTHVIVQNPDDRKTIQSIVSIPSDRMVLIRGSGVDLNRCQVAPFPSGAPVFLLASRLLATKGVFEFVAAAKSLTESGVAARFWLVGNPDPANPASISSSLVAQWREQGNIQIFGHRDDIPSVMSQASVIVLPSYREGLPKVLIEAAACGRAVITSDVPGCRDAIVPGVTGILVPPKNIDALAAAMRLMCDDLGLCAAMGAAGRVHAEKNFGIESVIEDHLNIYNNLVSSK